MILPAAIYYYYFLIHDDAEIRHAAAMPPPRVTLRAFQLYMMPLATLLIRQLILP